MTKRRAADRASRAKAVAGEGDFYGWFGD